MALRRFLMAAILFALAGSASHASPECCRANLGPTLVDECAQADVVLLAHVDQEPRLEGEDYYADLIVDEVIKAHPLIKGKNTITVKQRIRKTASKFLVFCDVTPDKGRLNPYKGVEVVPGGDLMKYFKAALALKEKGAQDRLRYSFDFLNSPDLEVASDAYRQFSKTDYKDEKAWCKNLPADKIAGWLRDPKTPPFRLGLLGTLLGHCGKATDGKVLRATIEDCLRKRNSDIDGLLAGYLMLQPKEAWAYVQGILRDGKEDFMVRYACVRIAYFLRDKEPGLVDQKDLVAGVVLVLDYPDMADHGMDFLRKGKCWDRTGAVLDLWGKKSPGKDYDNDYIKRAILRFALSSPDPRAVRFVKEQRDRIPNTVNLVEELLKLDP